MKEESKCVILPLAAFLQPLRNVAKKHTLLKTCTDTFLETKRETQVLIETSTSDSGLIVD